MGRITASANRPMSCMTPEVNATSRSRKPTEASWSAIRAQARLWRQMALMQGWFSDLPMYARTPTVRQSPCKLLAPSTAMACRTLLAGNRGA